MKEKRRNIGYVVDQLVVEMMDEMREVMDAKSYNLNTGLLRKAIQRSVCRGIEEGLNLSSDYIPARYKPGFSCRTSTRVVGKD